MPLRPPAGYIRPGYNPLQVANAPTVGTASAGDQSASVAFTAPSNVGGGAILLYYAVSSPGQFTGTSVTSPVTVTGLTNGTSYTFTVWAANPFGPSPYSASSNSVTPSFTYIEDVFSTYLYTGIGSPTIGAGQGLPAQTITNGIDLSTKGGLVWVKPRNNPNSFNSHVLVDTARGADFRLFSNLDIGQSFNSSINNFSTTGFQVSGIDTNNSQNNYASWTFRKQAKFFDVVTYTGTGSVQNIAHNLGSVPGCIIVKRTDAAADWAVYHRSTGSTNVLFLNGTNAAVTSSVYWNNTDPTATQFTVGTNFRVNTNGGTYVAYIFAHDAGSFGLTGTDNVISCGSFTTNAGGVATAPINLGYEPQWVMIKQSSGGGGDWLIADVMRGASQTNCALLWADLSDAEFNYSVPIVTPTATGFNAQSLSGLETYIYIAIRRGPMKTPTTGTSVFNPVTNSNNIDSSTPVALNPPASDLWLNSRLSAAAPYWLPRLAGWDYTRSSSTAAEATSYTWTQTTQSDLLPNLIWWSTNPSQVNYFFRRAPSFFDVVCYTGNGSSSTTLNHNLGVAPELWIVKSRSNSSSWIVGSTSFASYQDKFMELQNTNALQTVSSTWNAVTSTTFGFGSGLSGDLNASGWTYVTYLFASCPGVSKVGSYTGTGALQTINCGFTGGARFVLIKRTDSTGDWFTYDSARGITSGNDPYLLLNSTASEVTGTNYVDTTSVGFQVTAAAPAGLNANGGTFVFLAIS